MTDESPADSAADPGARKRTTVELDDFWLERAVDATLLATQYAASNSKLCIWTS
jgi:Arc/MetJ family transcription regulator